MFSLEVQNYTNYNLIRSVVMEEMVHMAIACNILAALGGTPRIAALSPRAPGKGLPGGAEPDLEVVIAPLSHRQLKNFMRLERPAILLSAERLRFVAPSPCSTISSIAAKSCSIADWSADLIQPRSRLEGGSARC